MTIQILSTEKEGDPRRITAKQVSELIRRLDSGGPDNSEYDFHLSEKSTDPLVMIYQGVLYPLSEVSHLIPQDPSTGDPVAAIDKNSRKWNQYTYTSHTGLVFIRGDYPFAIVPIREGGQQQRFYAARRVVGKSPSSSFDPGDHLVRLEKGSEWAGLKDETKPPLWLLPDYLDTDTIKSVWDRGKKS